MRFDRAPDPTSPGTGPIDRLVRRTSRGLAVLTLLLIAALLAAVGLVTAAVAISATGRAVDRNLEAAADARLTALRAQLAEVKTRPTASPDDTDDRPDEDDADDDSNGDPRNDGRDDDDADVDNSGRGGDNSGPGSDNSGRGGGDDDDGDDEETPEPRATDSPSPSPLPTPRATAEPSPTFGLPVVDAGMPGSADTFFLLLGSDGEILSNPQRIAVTGLPDWSAVDAALATGEDWRTVTPGGIPVRLLTQPVVDVDGSVAGVLQSGFELTLQEQQTRQLVTAIAIVSLIGLLGAGAVTLLVTSRAMRPIRSAFAAERRFVAAASHELRTPVAVVRASGEILQREDLVKPDGRKFVEDIVSESDRLGRLIGDMLALASAEAGAMTVERRPIEMRAFVADLARRAESLASERGVRLEIAPESAAADDGPLVVSADPDRMTQLLMIFVDNAIAHSPAGGTIRLSVRPVSEAGRPRVEIGVADQGPGVPPDERARIFEPFARLAGRRRQTGSTGLGLAIARILAARQDATLRVDDAAGGGALFSVSLPRRPPHESGSFA